ncbi:MAG: hypothetical protein J6Z40_01755 [Oscillospiraceae bacterium]|nr:hypothetical protein [Oscillospiraceae bacterium]
MIRSKNGVILMNENQNSQITNNSVNNRLKDNKTIIIICVIIVLILGIPFSIRHKQKNMIEKICSDFRDNENKAKKKYEGKEITLIGAVDSISGSKFTIIPLEDKNDLLSGVGTLASRYATCKVHDEKNQKRIDKLKTGKKVKVKGTVHVQSAMGFIVIEVDVDKIS